MLKSQKETVSKSYPKVLTVFGYTNPKAPKTEALEFDRLIALFQKINCHNVAKFIESIRFEETQRNVTMSYNFVLCPRDITLNKETSLDEAMSFFQQSDFLVGTRRGVEGAMVFFKKLAEFVESLDQEHLQFTDGIFSEALVYFCGNVEKTSLTELAEIAFGENLPQETTTFPVKKH